jgi:histidinol-phosphatase (PHP family)
MERTCERALELGLRSVAFTDHADFTAATLLSDPARLPARFRRWVRDGMLAPRRCRWRATWSACSAAASAFRT